MHTAEAGLSFDSENAKDIDYGRFKGERFVKEAMHSGTQAVSRCASLQAQYKATQIRTNHKEKRHIQAGDRFRARTDPPVGEAPAKGSSFAGPITRARASMMAEAGPHPPS